MIAPAARVDLRCVIFERLRAGAARYGSGGLNALWHLMTHSSFDDGCWLYGGGEAYGCLCMVVRGRTIRGAHAVAYTLHRRLPAVGMYVVHHCDRKACCNPDHLDEGTHASNVRDYVERVLIPSRRYGSFIVIPVEPPLIAEAA